jgi:hypothetical protein
MSFWRAFVLGCPIVRRVSVVGNSGSGKSRLVMDGNYSAVRPLVWARADTVVWLDLPRQFCGFMTGPVGYANT